MTAISTEQRRVEHFLSRLPTLTLEQWRQIIDARPSDDRCAAAAHVIDVAKEVSGWGPKAEVQEYTLHVYSRIEHLVNSQPLSAIAAKVDSTVLLAHVIKEAANALLVAHRNDFDLGDKHYEPKGAAEILYGPFEPFIPILSLDAP